MAATYSYNRKCPGAFSGQRALRAFHFTLPLLWTWIRLLDATTQHTNGSPQVRCCGACDHSQLTCPSFHAVLRTAAVTGADGFEIILCHSVPLGKALYMSVSLEDALNHLRHQHSTETNTENFKQPSGNAFNHAWWTPEWSSVLEITYSTYPSQVYVPHVNLHWEKSLLHL